MLENVLMGKNGCVYFSVFPLPFFTSCSFFQYLQKRAADGDLSLDTTYIMFINILHGLYCNLDIKVLKKMSKDVTSVI